MKKVYARTLFIALSWLLFMHSFVVAVYAGTTAPIYGSVFHDFSRDGTRQANEPAIAGMTITLISVAEPHTSYSGMSNDEGYFSVMVPVPGVYDMYVEQNSGGFSSVYLYKRGVDMSQPGAGNGLQVDVILRTEFVFLPYGAQ